MNEVAMPVIEYKVKWQLVHDEEWDQLQQPDVQELVVPRGIITVDTKRQCRDTMVIGYAGVIAPTCYVYLLAPDVLGMIARAISDLDYNYWNPTPSVLATRVTCHAMKHAIDMHASVQYYGQVGPWIEATARVARWDEARQHQLDLEWGSEGRILNIHMAEQREAECTFQLWMWTMMSYREHYNDANDDQLDSEQDSDNLSESENEDDVRRNSDWNSDEVSSDTDDVCSDAHTFDWMTANMGYSAREGPPSIADDLSEFDVDDDTTDFENGGGSESFGYAGTIAHVRY
jgi:hypothetical protein